MTRSQTSEAKPAAAGCRRRLLIASLGFLAVVAILMVALMWRLNRGPIELDSLEPYLEWTLGSGDDAQQISAKNPVIAWGGWSRPTDLRAGPVIVSDARDRTVVEFEDVSVGIALLELIHKKVVLTRVEVRSIHLQLLRTSDGRIVMGFEAGDPRAKPPPSQDQSAFQKKLQEVFTSPHRVPPFDRLDLVSVANSRATIDDRVLGRTWHIPALDLEMKPRGNIIDISAGVTVDAAGQPTEATVRATFDRTAQRLRANASIEALNPAMVAQLIPQLGSLRNADVDLDLTANGEVSTDGTVHSVGLGLDSSWGRLIGSATPQDNGDYSLKAEITDFQVAPFATFLPLLANVDLIVNGTATAGISSDLRVTGLTADIDTGIGNVAGTLNVDDEGGVSTEVAVTQFEPWRLAGLSPELDRVRIPLSADVSAKLSAEHALDSAAITVTGGKGSIQVPEVHPLGFDLEGLSLAASIDDGMSSVRLSKLEVNLDGLVIRANGNVDRGETATVITANARLSDLEAAHIRDYWPSKLVPDVLAWISTNITSGTVRNAEARVGLSIPAQAGGSLKLDQLSGSFGFHDLEVAYLRPMPAATGVTGTGSFTAAGFDFKVGSGAVRDLSVGSAQVQIAPLSGFTRLSVDAVGIIGPVRTAMDAIAGPPLELIGPTLPQPDQFSGSAVSHLVLEVPLAGGDPQPLEVSGSSRLDGLGLAGWVEGYTLTEGALDVTFDLANLDVTGGVSVNGAPATVTWHENLVPQAVPRTVVASATLDQSSRAALGIPNMTQIAGAVVVDVAVTGRADGSMDVELEADLANTPVHIHKLGWSKPADVPGGVQASGTIGADFAVTVDRFTANAPDFRTEGSLATAPGLSALLRFDLKDLKWGSNQVFGGLSAREGGGWDIVVRGNRVNIRPLLSPSQEEETQPPPSDEPDDSGSFPPLSIDIRINELMDGPRHRLGRLNATATRNDSAWTHLMCDLEVAPDNVFAIRGGASDRGGHDLEVTAANAGEVLSALLPESDVTGGALQITAHRPAPDESWAGQASLEDYVVTESKTLTSLLQVASIGGALEALQGNGLEFSRLDLDFTFFQKTLGISGFRTHGSALGLTADGEVDFNTLELDIKGAAVPASRIQNLLGKIPGLGVILTGTKKEGLIAVNYRIKGPASAPEISVNPLSGLTPGILRDMFRVPEGSEQ